MSLQFLLLTCFADMSTGDQLIIQRKYPNVSESELFTGDMSELLSLNRFYGIPISPLGSAVLHYKCNITHITPNDTEYELCIYYNPPPIKFVTLINKMNHNRSTALERSIINYGGGGLKPGFMGFHALFNNGNFTIAYPGCNALPNENGLYFLITVRCVSGIDPCTESSSVFERQGLS